MVAKILRTLGLGLLAFAFVLIGLVLMSLDSRTGRDDLRRIMFQQQKEKQQ